MVKIVGLHGVATHKGQRIGSAKVGKDAASNFFVRQSFYHTSFAKPIYKIANEVYGINTDNLSDFDKDGRIYEPWGMTLRQILQGIGDMFRAKDPEFFLKCLEVDIANNARGRRVVVSDVRYENEAQLIRKTGTILHISRELENYSVESHSSEVGVKATDNDLFIFNTGSLHELGNKVLKIINKLD